MTNARRARRRPKAGRSPAKIKAATHKADFCATTVAKMSPPPKMPK